jgi:Arc/MetJ family transcription regulator
MVDATRETARAVALGLVAEREEAVEAAVRARLGASFDASILREGRDVTVRVAAPLAVVSVFELLDLVVDEVGASATMRLEPEF